MCSQHIFFYLPVHQIYQVTGQGKLPSPHAAQAWGCLLPTYRFHHKSAEGLQNKMDPEEQNQPKEKNHKRINLLLLINIALINK